MQIAAFSDVIINRKQWEIPEGYAWRTQFLQPPAGISGEPHAFLAEGTAKRFIRPHFHIVDQFQVIVRGSATLGKHEVGLHCVHFARAHTPYGPLVAGKDGLGFLTLRASRDPGAQHLPGAKDKLMKIPNRKPWQVTETPDFSGDGDVTVRGFSKISDQRGLRCYSLKAKAGVQASAPDPFGSGGQYLVITKGSIVYLGKHHAAITVVFLKPHEAPFQLVAGPEGVEALVLNFPREAKTGETQHKDKSTMAATARVWQCQLCAFSYDEAKGMPEEGIAAGTRWEDVPKTWTCPDCSASKADFR